MRADEAIGSMFLVAAVLGCETPKAGDAVPSTVAATSTVSAPAPTSVRLVPGPPMAPPRGELALSPSTERARKDTLVRLPRLRGLPVVRSAFPPEVQRVLESPDELILYSVDWKGNDQELASLLDDDADRRNVVGQLILGPDDRLSVVAWLYEGMTRPFAGMKCDQPHHAFRFRKGSTAVAIAVCFECGTFAIRGERVHRSSVRWDPSFRDFLKAHLEASGIRDLSSDLRP